MLHRWPQYPLERAPLSNQMIVEFSMVVQKQFEHRDRVNFQLFFYLTNLTLKHVGSYVENIS